MKSSDLIKRLGLIYKTARRFPVIGADKLLNVDLAYYQKDMLNKIWNNKYPLLNCSRRTGKSFVITLSGVMRCLLYPNYTFLITAPVFKQAKTCFLMAEEMYKNSSLLQSEVVGEPKHGSSEWIMPFKNGSKIIAMPLADSIRSKGANGVHLDEAGFNTRGSVNQKINSILIPMLFTKRDTNSDLAGDIGNQIIISSTSTFKWNDFYKKCEEYQKEIENGSKQHVIISYDFIDGIKGGKFEEQLVLNEFKKADPITQKMEYLNISPDGEDGFITYKLLQDKAIDLPEIQENEKYEEPETKIEFEQPYDKDGLPKYKYIMAVDDASQGYDNFAVALIKIDKDIKRLVRVKTLNNARTKDKIKLIRNLLRKFNIIKIVADQRHQSVKDGLAEPYQYDDGYIGDIIVDKDDREQIRTVKNEYDEGDINKLLEIHNFSNKTNETRARHFLNEIEKGRFKIPADPVDGFKSKDEEDAYNEIKQTIFEITCIKIKPYQSVVRYEPESDRQTKDRWTVCELGTYMADQYLKNKYKRNNNNKITLGRWSK